MDKGQGLIKGMEAKTKQKNKYKLKTLICTSITKNVIIYYSGGHVLHVRKQTSFGGFNPSEGASAVLAHIASLLSSRFAPCNHTHDFLTSMPFLFVPL